MTMAMKMMTTFAGDDSRPIELVPWSANHSQAISFFSHNPNNQNHDDDEVMTVTMMMTRHDDHDDDE